MTSSMPSGCYCKGAAWGSNPLSVRSMALLRRWKSRWSGHSVIYWNRRKDAKPMSKPTLQRATKPTALRRSGQLLWVIAQKRGPSRWVRCSLVSGRLTFYDLTSRKFVPAASVLKVMGGFRRVMRLLHRQCSVSQKFSTLALVISFPESTFSMSSTTSAQPSPHAARLKLRSFLMAMPNG